MCVTCFCETGNEAEYTRIDRPLYRPPRSHVGRLVSCCHSMRLLSFSNHYFLVWTVQHPRVHGFPGCRGPTFKPTKGKLDSRFILDVTVMDGTPMSPSTLFTKIWRMRNNGTVNWPVGTQLLWIGGDRFSDSVSSLLEVRRSNFHGHQISCENPCSRFEDDLLDPKWVILVVFLKIQNSSLLRI